MFFVCRRNFSAKRVKIEGEFPLELGGKLNDVEMVYEEWGRKDAEKIVLLFPSFSMSCHAHSTAQNPTTGWYEGFIGRRKAIDTQHFRVICPSNLGSPFGSTSPISLDENGNVYGKNFPQITPFDMARAVYEMLRKIGVHKVYSVIGGSMGGNLTLSFCSIFPSFTSKAIAMCCTGRTSPLSVGFRHIQRTAIKSDPDWRGGEYAKYGTFPYKGLSTARQLAMMVYKSFENHNTKFDWTTRLPTHFCDDSSFEIESYLSYQGNKFSRSQFDANCYLLLSKAVDLTNLAFRGTESSFGTAATIGESYLDAVLRIEANLLIFGVSSDIVIPLNEQAEIYNILNAKNQGCVRFDVSDSSYGHDAFIVDEDYFVPKIRSFLESDVVEGVKGGRSHC